MITPKINPVDANSFYTQINAPQQNAVQTQKSKNNKSLSQREYSPSWFDKIIDKTVNQRDLNDTVIVPRSIFKGYLGFTAVSSLTILAGLIPDSASKPLKVVKTAMGAVGAVIMTAATYHFVKPFLATKKHPDKK